MKGRLTFLDFETTGFTENRALALAIVHYDNGARVFEKYYLINPNAQIERGAIRVHGITSEQVRNKPNFQRIWQEIRIYIEGSMVVAHNAAFDIRVLMGELERYNLECGQFSYYCTCNNARSLHLPVENHKLDTLCRYFSINLENHHNALADTVACENIYFNLIQAKRKHSVSNCMGRERRVAE